MILTLIATPALACRDRVPERDEAASPGRDSASEADVADPSSDSLRLWLEVPERVAAGEPVPMALRAENTTGRSLDLHLTGRPIAFDLIVTDEDGRVVWRRLADEVIAAVLRLETLGPGDTLTLEGRWDQRSNAGDPVSPGVYSARGELPTDGDPLVTPEVALRIVSG